MGSGRVALSGCGIRESDPLASLAHPIVDALLDRWRATRTRTLALAAPLSDADASAQSMPDCSPAKWHLAHTTWFLEAFVLGQHSRGYRAFDPGFDRIFNSYYESLGPRFTRAKRGLLTRPGLDRVRDYRAHVEAGIEAAWPNLGTDARALIELGIAHEEQHQELLLTDMLHLFAENPLAPAMFDKSVPLPLVGRGRVAVSDRAVHGKTSHRATTQQSPQGEGVEGGPGWTEHPGGVATIGNAGPGFAFDAEGPAHDALLQPFAIAERLVTNAEWDGFVADGGYKQPLLWLSDGWDWVRREGVTAPMHWREDGRQFTLSGLCGRDPAAPAAHISHYEADAYATWAGGRLPTEAEWEAAAASHDPCGGNQLDEAGPVAPRPGTGRMFGDCWQWTRSAFLPHPGYRPATGAVGEYNGKFMSGQMVLKGASCATPRGHSRASYRNFFPPHARWQFSGVRLARDL